MKNEISHRKTPHALRTRMTFDGVEKFIETRWAWAFEVDGDFTSPLVWKEVKLTHCFVKSKRQEIADKQLRSKDMRSWTVDVHFARQQNLRKHGVWKTDWEMQEAEKLKTIKTFTLDYFFIDDFKSA